MQTPSFLHGLAFLFGAMLMSQTIHALPSSGHKVHSNSTFFVADTDVVINEIHYNPCGSQGSDGDYEFVELYNTGSTTVDLSGWYFDQGFSFTFPNGSSIAPGEYIVIARDEDSYAGNGYQVFEWSNGGLSNQGEDIRLRNDNNNTIDYVDYDNGGSWPDADGDCPSMELIDASSNNDTSGAWAESDGYGSPGEVNSVSAVQGCTDPTADNYNSEATVDNGTCTYTVLGCTDPLASNFNNAANTDDGSCTYDPAIASFTYNLISANCGVLTYEFTNTSTNAQSFSWAFGTLETSIETSPTVTFPAGDPIVVTLTATNPAGSNSSNQTVSLTDNSGGVLITMELQPDCYAGELGWSFLDQNDTEIDGQAEGALSTTNLISRDFCVTNECYSLELTDSYGDGFGGSQYTNCFDGSLLFKTALGDTLYVYEGPADWGFSLSIPLCITEGCTDLTASNYDSTALLDDGSCTYAAPSADFAYTIVSNECGRATINFTNNSSGAANNNWSFTLLGETSTEFEPILEVPSDISFDVNLEVSNGMGSADTSITVIVPPSTTNGTFVTFSFTPDCFGNELSWTLSNSANEVIASVVADTYPITTGTPATVNYEFCLPDDCYTVDLADTYGDGFAGDGIGFTSGETCGFDGTYSFLDENNNVISQYLGAADFGLSSSDVHCVNEIYVWKGTVSSDWNTDGNWESNSTPVNGKSIVIDTQTFHPDFNADLDVKNMTINSGSEINVTDASSRLGVSGNFVNNGVFNSRKGSVQFNGGSFQMIKGSSVSKFNKLRVMEGSNVAMFQDVHLWGALQMSDGTFNMLNNELTLLSDATSTGSIGTLSNTESIIGDEINYNRFYASGSGNWRMIGCPIEGITFEQWNDDIPTTGFAGSDFPTYPFSNIRTYEESYIIGDEADKDFGFESIQNLTDTISNQEGYFVYFDPASTTIDVKGKFKRGTQNIPLSYNLSEMAGANDGWNLVSNPYPSAIDWDSPGIVKSGLADAIYIYDPSVGAYSTFINGIQVGQLDGLIASGQAFWVKATQNNPSLVIEETAKSDDQGVHFRSMDFATTATIRIELEHNGNTDEVVFGFNDNCSQAFDQNHDAFKFYPSSPNTPSLAMYPEGIEEEAYVIALSEFPSEAFEMPLEVKKGTQSNFTLSLTEIDAEQELCLYLEDLELNQKFALTLGESYEFEMGDTSPEQRFIVHMRPPLDVSVLNENCEDADDGEIIAQGFGEGPWDFTWTDEMGQIVQENFGMSTADHVVDLAPGMYTVQVSGSEEFCSSTSAIVMVETAEEIQYSSNFQVSNCDDESGSIEVEIEDEYTWNFELLDEEYNVLGSFSTDEDDIFFDHLSAQSYQVIGTNECDNTVSIENIDLRDPNSSTVQIDEMETNFVVNENIVFSASTENANEVEWNLGDGNIINNNTNLIYEYQEEGTFEVVLTASNDFCSSTDTLLINIEAREVADIGVPFVDINAEEAEEDKTKGEDFSLNINEAEISISSDALGQYEELNVRIYSITGQIVFDALLPNGGTTLLLDRSELSQGVYQVELSNKEMIVFTEKCYLN